MKIKVAKHIQTLIFLVLMGCLFLIGCEPENRQRVISQSRKNEVLNAYNSGLAALMKEPKLNPDVIWILQQIAKINPDETLQKFIEEKTAIVPEHLALCAIIPDAPRVELPEQLPSGFSRYRECLLAPFGAPAERAVSFIEVFLSTDERGYVLTHQFLVLIWAEQMDLEIPEHLQNKKEKLLQAILNEHRDDDIFSDLYAERAAMLLYYGNPDAREADKWINKIIDSQMDDGNWGVHPALVNYDGQAVMLTSPKQHATVLSLWALYAYLDVE